MCLPSEAQLFKKRKAASSRTATEELASGKDRAPKPRTPKGTPMFYEVFDGDTVYMDVIDPVWVFPKGRKAGKDREDAPPENLSEKHVAKIQKTAGIWRISENI